MNETVCPSHRDHEHRISRLEGEMSEVQTHIKKSSVTVAIISFLGVLLTAMTSFLGVVITAVLKGKGVI